MSERKTTESLGFALATLASASAAPYGYTISIWSSGAILVHYRGAPNVGDVFLFAAGALAGYTLIGLLVHRRLRAVGPTHSAPERVLAGVLHWFAVGAALGAVALLAQIDSPLAWLLSMFAATTIYLVGATIQLAAVTGRARR